MAALPDPPCLIRPALTHIDDASLKQATPALQAAAKCLVSRCVAESQSLFVPATVTLELE
jgi:hypothetical protein